MYTLEAVIFEATGKSREMKYHNQWNILRKGFEKSAKNTNAIVNIHELPKLRCKTRTELETNYFKLKKWRDIVKEAKNPLVLVDIDLCFLSDIECGFSDKDITLTRRHKRWCNAGVIFVRPGEYANRFFDRWCEMDHYLHGGDLDANKQPKRLSDAWRKTGVMGHNQTSLAMIQNEFEFGWVPGWKYNASLREEWNMIGQKVIHVKDSLRKDLFRSRDKYEIIKEIKPYYF
jgi:hypothetical protein